MLSLTFGYFGIDRFYIGNIILGIFKLIAFGASSSRPSSTGS
jgi:TM2 domain-containing membrane protein YozV